MPDSRLAKRLGVTGAVSVFLFMIFSLSSCTSGVKKTEGAPQENITLAQIAEVMGKAEAQHSGVFDVTQSEHELFLVYHFYTAEQKDIDDDIGIEMGPKIRALYKKFKSLDRVYFDIDVWRSGVDSDWTSYCHFVMTRDIFDKTEWAKVLDAEFFKVVQDLKYNE